MDGLRDGLRIASWRMRRRYGIPSAEIDDFLHDAIVVYLESGTILDDVSEYSLGNWLARVAFYKWHSHRHRLSTRKTRPLGETQPGTASPGHCVESPDTVLQAQEDRKATEKRCSQIMQQVGPKLAETIQLYGRGCTMQQAADVLGITRQGVSLRIQSIGMRINEDQESANRPADSGPGERSKA